MPAELSDRTLAALVRLAEASVELLQLDAGRATTTDEVHEAARRATDSLARALAHSPPDLWPASTMTLLFVILARFGERERAALDRLAGLTAPGEN